MSYRLSLNRNRSFDDERYVRMVERRNVFVFREVPDKLLVSFAEFFGQPVCARIRYAGRIDDRFVTAHDVDESEVALIEHVDL